jgi:hypothetical protein
MLLGGLTSRRVRELTGGVAAAAARDHAGSLRLKRCEKRERERFGGGGGGSGAAASALCVSVGLRDTFALPFGMAGVMAALALLVFRERKVAGISVAEGVLGLRRKPNDECGRGGALGGGERPCPASEGTLRTGDAGRTLGLLVWLLLGERLGPEAGVWSREEELLLPRIELINALLEREIVLRRLGRCGE